MLLRNVRMTRLMESNEMYFNGYPISSKFIAFLIIPYR